MQHFNTPFSICSHFEKCAGCQERLSLQPPLIWEEVLSFFHPFSLSPHLHMGSPMHWRHRAKVAVRGRSNQPLIGLFKQFSHDVISIPNCLVHHPHLNKAFDLVRLWIQKHGIVPYDEKTGRGLLRYVQGVVQRLTGRVQLALVFNASPSDSQVQHWRDLVEQLGEESSSFWHSLWINFQNQPINTIFGPEWLHGWGEELLWEKFGEVDVCYGPASFGQANLPLFERLLFRIRELVPLEACITEFYAGVGVIGLFMASQCQWIQCSEVNPFAETYFQHSCAKLPPHIASRLKFVSGSTEETLFLLEGATTVIVDPPRKGLDSCLFSALQESSTVKQLLYISCGWEAFQRDCQKLCQFGWKVQSVDGYVFFPGSNHIELLVHFKK